MIKSSKKKPSLSIAIPTYNGEISIKYVIDAFLKANIEGVTIEIIVSDNCSCDSTESICKNFSFKNNILFKYNRNEQNIGFDRNVIRAVSMASSDFVWICSDNEVLIDKNGVKKIISLTEAYAPNFLFLEHNNEIILKNCKITYQDGDSFFMATKFKSGLISNCVIKKSIWDTIDFSPYLDKNWIHFAYQIEALAPINNKNNKTDAGWGGGCILEQKIFESIPTTRTWGNNGTFIDVGLQLLDIFSSLKRLGYSQNTIRLAKLVIKGGYPSNLLLARKQGYTFDIQKIKYMYKFYKEFPSFYLIDIPSMILPIMFCDIVLSLVKLIRKITKLKH